MNYEIVDYEVVDKAEIPPERRNRKGRAPIYRPIFEDLENNKAIKFVFPSYQASLRMGQSIAQSIKVQKCGYKIHYRTVPDSAKVRLYVWKEQEK